ncbi:MAG TPA: hypothetical protein VEJ16_00595 [Alphaproteobacteria bacterium]|nr:hypothetical protein [Alphaproteobacteria bacterium]
MTRNTQKGKDRSTGRPALTPEGEASARLRKARLAAALRENLRRRRTDLAGRSDVETPPSAAGRPPKRDGVD